MTYELYCNSVTGVDNQEQVRHIADIERRLSSLEGGIGSTKVCFKKTFLYCFINIIKGITKTNIYYTWVIRGKAFTFGWE